tara:strand:+ start:126 stop:392 length:267 start_codon:yes stop_codon:yes gene_type:complete
MDEIFFKLLEQTPVIIVLGLGIWDYRSKLNAKDKEAFCERKTHRKELKETNDKHAQELKDLNAYVREHEKGHLEALDKLSDTLERLSN